MVLTGLVYLDLLLLGVIGGAVGLIGGIVFLYSRTLSKSLEKYSIPFAAGVLITVSILGLLPEALELAGEDVFLMVLVSFFASYIFENLFFDIHHHSNHGHGKSLKASVPLVIFGDTIHNFIDGIAIGASYFISPGLGFITAISTLLHEIPHEVGDFGILLKAGWKKKNIVIVNLLSSGVTVVGAFMMVRFSGNDSLTGSLMAISAGIFLYLGTNDFLPHISLDKANKGKILTPLFLGVIAMAILILVIS